MTILTACLALFALASAVVAFIAMGKADSVAREQARIAAEQARATQGLGVTATKQLAASMAPIVADVGQDLLEEAGTDRLQWVVVEQDGGARNITLPCRNVGPGPAVIMAAVVVPTEYDASTRTTNVVFEDGAPAELSLGVIPPGETVLIKASLQPRDADAATIIKALGLCFCAMVRYTDVAGEQRRSSTIYVLPHDPNRHVETAVRVHECDSGWNQVRPIMAARRVLVVPTASDRLGTLFEDTSVRISELNDTVTESFDRIEAIYAERNERLKAAADWIDPRITKLGRQIREANEATEATARATGETHGGQPSPRRGLAHTDRVCAARLVTVGAALGAPNGGHPRATRRSGASVSIPVPARSWHERHQAVADAGVRQASSLTIRSR